ncbi:hypothetical protein TRVL_09076 [Trypanosoma vivax]|nr:hypothetical protein TRVL_09076 [Trypanosoma vivax]
MGDPHALLGALGAFGGLLVPVFGGCYLPHAGDRNTSTGGCVMQGDLPLPCGASTGCPRLEGTLPSLFLTFLAQEAHKLAFAVTWVNFRAVARVPPDDGSPGSESCWSHCGRTVPVHSSPAGLLWSVHFYCLSRLALCSCGAEEFCSLVKVAEGMQVGGMPFVYVAALAAGALVASFPARCDWVAPLQEKLQVLCGTGSTAPSTLQRYIALPVADELERFTLLWFGGTWLTSLKKFKSRSELLFFALVELVLLGSEEQWRRPGLFTSSDEQETAERALAGWLEGCRNLFAGANGDGGDGVARDLCARLPQRLERGASPCGAVGAILYPGGARSDDLASVFAAAQRAFATLVSAADSEQKLRIYGLYKQATAGNISVAKPYFVDVVGRAKWEAWNALKGMDAETARRGYVRAVDELRSSVDSRRQCS